MCTQVNGKLYPLAKIQLGGMGALHPANRLAAYLTGRVGTGKSTKPPQQQPATAPRRSAGKPPEPAASGGTGQAPPIPATPSTTAITLKLTEATTGEDY